MSFASYGCCHPCFYYQVPATIHENESATTTTNNATTTNNSTSNNSVAINSTTAAADNKAGVNIKIFFFMRILTGAFLKVPSGQSIGPLIYEVYLFCLNPAHNDNPAWLIT